MRPLLPSLLALWCTPVAEAGWYVASHAKWGAFAARPQATEATPNYYGYGIGLGSGYSISQFFDLGLYGSYLPGNRQEAKLGEPDAELALYGGELAFRFGQAVYLGFRGGATQYNMPTAQAEKPEELTGAWTGMGGAVSVGGIVKLDRQNFLQTSIELLHTTMESKTDPTLGERKLDAFAVTFGYTFNDYTSTLLENSILGEFVKSINFF